MDVIARLQDVGKALPEIGRATEGAIIATAARVGPILGPVPTAYLVADRTMDHLRWPAWVATISGVMLECLGIATGATLLKLWLYRREKLKTDPDAPSPALAGVLLALYFVAAVSLTVVLDVAALPRERIGAANFAPVLFPILSLASVGLLAIRSANGYALLGKSQRKIERKLRSLEEKAAIARAQEEIAQAGEGIAVQTSASRFFAECEICEWEGKPDGYSSARARTNALNAHDCRPTRSTTFRHK